MEVITMNRDGRDGGGGEQNGGGSESFVLDT